MRIGELSRATGLSAATLRYYERLGLLPKPARRSGKRWYDEDGLHRARMLKAGRTAGLSIADLVQLTRNGGDTAARQAVLSGRQQRVDLEIERLERKRELLRLAAACGCEKIDACSIYG